jgi:NADH:ubiquinone oxidoreductase subunit E
MTDAKQKIELAICMGSSCFSRGNKRNIELIKEYIKRFGLCDKLVLKGHLCEGLCNEGPNICLEKQVHHSVDATSISTLLDSYIKKEGIERKDE